MEAGETDHWLRILAVLPEDLVARLSLSNYIKILVQQEACDWTGKRETELRVTHTHTHTHTERERERERERLEGETGEARWTQTGRYRLSVALNSHR